MPLPTRRGCGPAWPRTDPAAPVQLSRTPRRTRGATPNDRGKCSSHTLLMNVVGPDTEGWTITLMNGLRATYEWLMSDRRLPYAAGGEGIAESSILQCAPDLNARPCSEAEAHAELR